MTIFKNLLAVGLTAMLLGVGLGNSASAATPKVIKKSLHAAKVKPGVATRQLASRNGKRVVKVSMVRLQPERPSFGQVYGLHATTDELDLKSSVALVLDQDTNEVLFSKNSQAVLPIASITKLMTAMVVAEAKLPLDEVLTVTQDDVDTEKGSRSRL